MIFKNFKLFFVITIMIALTTACSNRKSDSYTIDINVKGVEDSIGILLRPITHDRNAPNIAEGVLSEGKLKLTGKVDEPTAAYIRFSNGYGLIPLMLDNTDVKIEGIVMANPTKNKGEYDYDFSQLSVKGSPLTDKYRAIYSVRDSLSRVHYEGRKKYEGIMMEYGTAKSTNDTDKIKEIEESDEFKEMNKFEESFMKNLESIYHAKIKEGNDSFWGPLTMLTYYVYFIPSMRPLYDEFSDEAKNSTYGEMVKKELYPVGFPGEKLADFESITDAGDSISMYELAQNNQFTLIDFWASWCRPCRAEIPNLKKLYDKYHDKNFHILSVSIDKNDDDWRKALASEQLPWTNCRDTEGNIADIYGVASIPMLVVVDSEGRLILENLRGEELENKLDELLGSN